MRILRTRLSKPIVCAAASALLAGALLVAICWERSGRSIAVGVYRWALGRSAAAPGLDLKSRPDMDRFASDRLVFEFAKTPAVDLPVDDPESPDYVVRRGVEVKVHSSGYTYPVNLAFAPRGDESDPEAPFYYVAELHGDVKYATRKGEVHAFATGLLDFPAVKMAISDELGLSGLCTVPGSHDLIVTHPVRRSPTSIFWNAITRLRSEDGGRSCARRETLLLLENEPTCPSNQIQQAQVGPDGKLYVSVGDAMNYAQSADLDRWGGKILRMNLDGSPCDDNPFRDPARPKSPRAYVYVSGLRNSFDFVLDPKGGGIWAGDVGESLNRIVRAARGSSHGWDGTPESFCRHAAFLFQDRFIPAGTTFVSGDVLGDEFDGCLWVAGYSYYFGADPGASKRIVSFRVKDGALASGPLGIVGYRGNAQSTMLGLKQGPDAVYFADFFGNQANGDAAGQGRVMNVSRSERTRLLAVDVHPPDWSRWPPPKRGKYVFAKIAGCGSCHTVEKVSVGREGPDLTDLATRLRAKVGSAEYRKMVASLLQSTDAGTAPSIEAVLNASGEAKPRAWLRSHIRNPRFDNPTGKMPQFPSLSEEDLGCLIEYLMSLEK